MDFKTWLTNHYMLKDGYFRNSRFGDLAQDVYYDSDFPITNNRGTIRRYLESRLACSECMDAFRDIWRRYAREVLRDA